MSKRSRRRADSAGRPNPAGRPMPAGGSIQPPGQARPVVPRTGQRRPVSQPSRPSVRLPILAVAAVVIGVVVVVAVALSNQPATGAQASLPAIQTGAPPWPADTAELRERLEADGLQVLTAEGQVQHTHQHLDLFVGGQAVTIPAGIGIDQAAGIISPIHTHDATGIIHVESPVVRDFTLGELFDVWGVHFDGHCIGGVCDGNGSTLSVFRNGQPVTGDARSLVLAAHDEIVVAIGTAAQLPSPIPSTFGFPVGD
jgi:hypothetical protein